MPTQQLVTRIFKHNGGVISYLQMHSTSKHSTNGWKPFFNFIKDSREFSHVTSLSSKVRQVVQKLRGL